MLTPRWYKLRPHDGQHELWHSPARFVVLPCGRRSGKSEIAKRKLILAALDPNTGYDDPNFFAAAPTRDQAKRIYWRDLKAFLPGRLIEKVSESEMMIRLINGASIYVVGMDKPERIEGMSWNGGILDEYANMKPKAWTENVRPALSDRRGWCWLIGVPEGRNHYYDLFQYALSEESGEEWAAFTWTSSEILPPEEIDSARAVLDELTYQQEYEASFVTFEGRCYYPFLRETHCAPLRHLYDPRGTLAFCFDFNVEPGVAAICQEVMLPNGLEGTAVIGEVYIPRNSNTPAVCRKLIQDWGQHQGRIVCYGDATGGSRGSAKIAGSDWDLIKAEFRQSSLSSKISYDVPSANPPERARVNAVNSRLKSESGDIRLMVDPQAAPHVVKDLEGVVLLKGGSGEIDKKSTPELSHMCFDGNTEIMTEKGLCKLSELPLAGKVKSWDGTLHAFENLYITKTNNPAVKILFDYGNSVISTPEHSYLTTEGWICAQNLEGKILMTPELLQYAVIQNSCFRGLLISGTMAKKDISGALQMMVNSISTGLYGYITTDLYPRDIISITLMEIEQIIRFLILQLLMEKNISQHTTEMCLTSFWKNGLNGLVRGESRPLNGIKVQRADNGIANMPKVVCQKNTNAHVSGAREHLLPKSKTHNFAVKTVKQDIVITPELMTRLVIACIVEQLFLSTDFHLKNIAQELALLKVSAVQDVERRDVYCISVPCTGCFCLKSGAIVSNSDALGYLVQRRFPIQGKPVTTMSTISSSRGEYYV